MHESEPDSKWDKPDIALNVENAPNEELLVIISMLMRLYDLQLSILGNMNQADADALFEAHSRGAHFNPNIFVPQLGGPVEDESDD